MHFAEEVGERPRDPSRAAADLEDPHLPGVLALADVGHVGEDLLLDGLPAGAEELLVGPLRLSRDDVEAGVLAGALVPVRLHLLELCFLIDRIHLAQL